MLLRLLKYCFVSSWESSSHSVSRRVDSFCIKAPTEPKLLLLLFSPPSILSRNTMMSENEGRSVGD
jgi:hypothetical protein